MNLFFLVNNWTNNLIANYSNLMWNNVASIIKIFLNSINRLYKQTLSSGALWTEMNRRLTLDCTQCCASTCTFVLLSKKVTKSESSVNLALLLHNDITSSLSLHSQHCSPQMGSPVDQESEESFFSSSGAFVLVPVFHHKHTHSCNCMYCSQGSEDKWPSLDYTWQDLNFSSPLIKVNYI